ncbi:hypothetical protein RJT34_23165 [Clitoria ternatea]|uniref:Uncharacterized protein n=1 Tax=Clitoria ternatea TaxID=43366 RepID=A0AAN9II58_CLITE
MGADPNGTSIGINLGRRCQLFLEGVLDPVAIGMVYSTGLMVHGQPLLNGMSSVFVVQNNPCKLKGTSKDERIDKKVIHTYLYMDQQSYCHVRKSRTHSGHPEIVAIVVVIEVVM